MAVVDKLTAADINFLESYLPKHEISTSDLPFVTLTYACSLDGMISLAPGLQTVLSGPQTKSVTHYLRLKHDAILVGVGTAISDDPGLNCRYPAATLETQPRPIIVDPDRRWSYNGSKLETLVKCSQGKLPWLIHSRKGHETLVDEADESSPCRIYLTSKFSPESDKPIIDWMEILRELKRKDVNSVMIEGGAMIIQTLLQTPAIVNSVLITVAPTWLGQGGISISPKSKECSEQRVNVASLQHAVWRQFGSDAVLCGTLVTA